MTMNNKILTVSYGTFSCTLEGFDDSFGTMKAIAEYFRDLAADDRYFGAEPPVPDAEMLTRIAEREISRRVEARQHDGRIVLSATEAPEEEAQAAASVETVAAPIAAAAIAAAVAETSATEDTQSPETVLDIEDTANEETPVVVEEDTLAEPETAEEAVAEDTDATAEDEIAEVVAEESAYDVESIDEDASATEIETDAIGADTVLDTEAELAADAETAADEDDDALMDAEAFFAASDNQDADTTEDEGEDIAVAETVEAETPPAPAADSIAAKLQRIRAVVSQGQQDSAEEELFEDEHAEDLPSEGDAHILTDEFAAEDEAASDDVVAEAARDIEDAFGIDDATDAAEEVEAEGEDELSALLARFDGDDTAEDTSDAQAEVEVAEADDAEEDLGLDTLAALMAADQEPDNVSGDGENLFDTEEASDESDEEETDAIAAEMADSVEADADEEQAPRRARVIKVKRADIDAALANGELEQVEDEAAETEDAEAASTLSDDEEAELLAELAQVEAELPAHTDGADTAEMSDIGETVAETDLDEATEEPEAAEAALFEDGAAEDVPAVAAESKALDVQDDDVSRLMAEAENQMEEPEGTNRRDAFAHLKAAVKAKKADADIGKDSIKDEGAFRSDLAEVVKPRRPEVGASRADRPETARPAPLKLVAEQRVDVDTTPKGPVRPRRIAAPQEVAQETQGADSFADYAAELGANDLPALLEAAASYLSFVEGQDQFSRPQLMTKVRQIEEHNFSREDSLRSFGQLLRAGKIEKISGGRFAVTSDIGYRPEQRAAG